MSEQDFTQDLFDEVDQVIAEQEEAPVSAARTKSKRKAGTRNYRSGHAESRTDRRRIAKATGKKASMAGQYERRSFTYRPAQLDAVEELAGQLGLSQNDLMRWFTDMGIDAVEQGTKPPVAQEIRQKYDPGQA